MAITVSLTLPKSHLRAAALFASKDETRYVLNGVCVETFGPVKRALLVATDGRRLACIRTAAVHAFPENSKESRSFIIPTKLIEILCCEENREKDVTLLYKKHDGAEFGVITLQYRSGEIAYNAPEVVGNYPKWTQVVPNKSQGTQPLLYCNPEFFASFSRAAELLGMSSFKVGMPDDPLDPLMIQIGEDFFGVLMPMRDGSSDLTQPLSHPGWIQDRLLASNPPESKA